MEMMKIQWKMRKSELLWMGGGLLVVYLLGAGLFAGIVMWTDDTAKAAVPLGTIIAAFALIIGHLIGGVCNMVHAFGLIISMGVTRKRFVWSYAGFSLMELLIGYILVRFLFVAEKWICYRTMGLLVYGSVQEFVQGSVGVAFLVLTGLLVLELLCAALVLKYGSKTYAVLWFLFMLLCYLPGILLRKGILPEDNVIMHWVQTNGGLQHVFPLMLAVLVLIEGVMLFCAWRMLRRQQVNV